MAEETEMKLAEIGESLDRGWVRKRKRNIIDEQIEATKAQAEKSKSDFNQIFVLSTLLWGMCLPLVNWSLCPASGHGF